MEQTALLGMQWGDEGKGKIIDLIASQYDIIARYQGGHNAGHTVVVGDKTYKLRHIPSGILRDDKIAFLGSGMVIELRALFEEIDELLANGVNVSATNLKIADNATLNLPLYQEIDHLLEHLLDSEKIGTTGKGIGVAYQEKVARRALRIADIFENDAILRSRIKHILAVHSPLLIAHGHSVPSEDDILQFLHSYRERLKPYVISAYTFFNDDELKAQKVLFEGAQGLMLDINLGTYPYVTSSSTHVAQIYPGTCVDFAPIQKVIGVLKAYSTRVGEGPFFTEDKGEFGKILQQKGHEVGTVTGRIRRCGALDLVAARYAVKLAGITEVALTKLDVLDEFENIPVCVAYELEDYESYYSSVVAQKQKARSVRNRNVDPRKDVDLTSNQIYHPPTTQSELTHIKPFYTNLLGWKKDISKIRRYEDLPENAMSYVEFIETYLRVPVTIISVGSERDQNIKKKVKA